jgi:hypothetical protein
MLKMRYAITLFHGKMIPTPVSEAHLPSLDCI